MTDPLAWHLHPEAWLLCLGLLGLYFGAIRRYGRLFHPRPSDPPITSGQRFAFVLGVALLWFASASPLHDIGERYLFSAHMIQHLIEVFAVPPLLLLGTPRWMAELVLRPAWLRRSVRAMGQPLVAAATFNALLLALHWPALIEWTLGSESLHVGVHAVLVGAALLMWLPVLSPVPHIVPRLSLPGQMGYLFLQTLLPTVPASFLTFGEAPLYAIYETFPRIWGISALHDMQMAGLIMKLGGGVLLWTIITILFFKWASREDRADHGEAAAPPVTSSTTG
ncbi:MAG: cytochrome c oxidase assembly protein [Actinobacteria bacterium]|nr:cytochrome c oxidase assembly protein [Actinomycetota bacterium]